MKEKKWLRSDDPEAMLRHAASVISPRQFRLLGCSACRQVWPLLDISEAKAIIDIVELHAGNLASGRALAQARQTSEQLFASSSNDIWEAVHFACCAEKWCDVVSIVQATIRVRDPLPTRHIYRTHLASYANLVRDVIPNPFRPNPLRDTWLTADVVGLARSIYAEYAFDRLPILADALMDAGCEDERVLDHCRSEGPHVRGCWVVDMLLGKS